MACVKAICVIVDTASCCNNCGLVWFSHSQSGCTTVLLSGEAS